MARNFIVRLKKKVVKLFPSLRNSEKKDEREISQGFGHNAAAKKTTANEFENYESMIDFFTRFEGFVTDSHRSLPHEGLTHFIDAAKKKLSPERFEAYLEHLERTNYKSIYEILYASEFVLGLNFRPGTVRHSQVFYRGKGDIARSEKSGADMGMDEGMYERRRISLDKLLTDEFLTGDYKNICEVGGAWGSTMRYLKGRFEPEKYYNFEIDGQWADWTSERFGSITMATDGETLSGISNESMDMVVCYDVLPWVPPLKIYSYLMEFARVSKKGTIVSFNLFVGDFLTAESAKERLRTSFPRRHFSHVPRQFILNSFPSDRFEILQESSLPPAEPDKVTYVIRCTKDG